MRTTNDLPYALVMGVKIRAAQDRRTIKDVAAEAVCSWLNVGRELCCDGNQQSDHQNNG